jgi:hypothetical protein
MSVPVGKIVEYINSTINPDEYKTTIETFPCTNPKTFRFQKFIGAETDLDNSDDKIDTNVYEDTEYFNLDAIEAVLAFNNEYVEIARYNDHIEEDYDTHMFIGYIRSILNNSTSDNHPCPTSPDRKKKVRIFLREFFDNKELTGFIYKTWTNDCSCCS